MSAVTARAPQPGNAKGRPVGGRPLIIHINTGNDDNSSEALRLQRLRLLGIIGVRANIIAGIAWGEVRNG